MIWCPNTGSICGEKVTPQPRTALLIATDKSVTGTVRSQIENIVKSVLKENRITVIFASDYRRGGSILCKICKLAQQVQFGVLIYDNEAKKPTIPNLFYESSLMHYLGKELIMIGYKTRRPSDLESVEWLKYENNAQFRRALKQRVKNIFANQKFYESMADNEISTSNYLVGLEYLKKLILMEPSLEVADKLATLNAKIKTVEAREYSNNLHFVTMTKKDFGN